MTAGHRRAKLETVRARLDAGEPVRLIATSLIEAGVDVSFPAMFRALAGLDSIAQAAGRCNRGGELGAENGRVYVFTPAPGEGRAPPSDVKQFADAAARILKDHPRDPLSLDAVRTYFQEVYWLKSDEGLDSVEVGDRKIRGIMKAIKDSSGGLDFVFADVAQAFRIIDEAMVPIIIPSSNAHAHGAPEDLLQALRFAVRPPTAVRTKLQQHSVQVPRRARSALMAVGAVELIRESDFADQFAVLSNSDLYDDARGLDWSDPTFREIESNMM